jgi:cellulose synthase/poly-beta-1,6-N-acetylglucosamine synthase-like glycosyltransferase
MDQQDQDGESGASAHRGRIRLRHRRRDNRACPEAVEFFLVEADDVNRVPDDLQQILPGLRVVRSAGKTSYDFKNAGARAAASDFVVLLDADCVPQPGWWRALIEHHRQHPEAAAISGRTLYRAAGLLPRILALIDRSYVDCGAPGRTRAVSNNNCAFRREILLKHPLRNELGPFGSKGHVDQMLADGCELRFEPGMRVEHGYGGWRMVQADRRQIGFAMTRYRQLNHDSSHA